MIESVIESLKSYGTFSPNEIKDFLSLLKYRKIKKSETILSIGDVCQEISFINQGSFLQYFKDEELNENVVNLFTTNDWVLNPASFTSQKPSQHKIEAFENSSIHTITIHDIHTLIGKYPSFFVLGKILEVVDYRKNNQLKPDEKYQLLLERNPQIIRKFPLKYIASFLGMTPETLSRVRGRLK